MEKLPLRPASAAMDAAVAVFNNLSNVSSFSADLHEFPIEENRLNYTASALHLFDLKSTVMELLIERLAKAQSNSEFLAKMSQL